jgi:hypothetical protein
MTRSVVRQACFAVMIRMRPVLLWAHSARLLERSSVTAYAADAANVSNDRLTNVAIPRIEICIAITPFRSRVS